ncbi:MAG: hypothetical protein ABI663_05660 [Chryseolinea sp.]
MKTKTILFGVVIAIIASLTLSTAHAQTQEQPSVKVVPGTNLNTIKVIYGYSTDQSVEVKFFNADGLIEKDVIKGKSFVEGFIKPYNVALMNGNTFWIEVESPQLIVTYKMVASKTGKWTPQLETTTYNYSLFASR